MEQVSLQSHSTLRQVGLQAPNFQRETGCPLRRSQVFWAQAETVGNMITSSLAGRTGSAAAISVFVPMVRCYGARNTAANTAAKRRAIRSARWSQSGPVG